MAPGAAAGRPLRGRAGHHGTREDDATQHALAVTGVDCGRLFAWMAGLGTVARGMLCRCGRVTE